MIILGDPFEKLYVTKIQKIIKLNVIIIVIFNLLKKHSESLFVFYIIQSKL